MTHLLCLGLGYTAQTLLRHLMRNSGWESGQFSGTSRDLSEKPADLAGLPDLNLMHFDGKSVPAELRPLIRSATHILHSIPPGADGDPALRSLASDLAEASNLRWFGYLSTTGVYGDQQGGWVDEDSPRLPAGTRGGHRLAAEDGWLSAWRDQALPLHIFRLPGIYGPGRNQLVSLKAGNAKRIVKAGQVFSRIHVADIAQTLAASMAQPNPGRAYNICDDEAAPPQDVVTFAAELLDLAPPPEMDFETAELSPMARSFYGESKRVKNHRIKQELGVALLYPTYREGLRALFSELEVTN